MNIAKIMQCTKNVLKKASISDEALLLLTAGGAGIFAMAAPDILYHSTKGNVDSSTKKWLLEEQEELQNTINSRHDEPVDTISKSTGSACF